MRGQPCPRTLVRNAGSSRKGLDICCMAQLYWSQKGCWTQPVTNLPRGACSMSPSASPKDARSRAHALPVLGSDRQLEAETRELRRALSELVRVYQFRDRDRICCYDISVSQC